MTVNSDGALPLAGVRVLAFTQLGAGPFAMTFLADLGAEVIKVEDPTTGGDEARAVPPFADAAARDGLYYQSFNRGTRSPTLNLRDPVGRELLHRLVAESGEQHVLVQVPDTKIFRQAFAIRRNGAG